jgi:predicted nuclease with TOPRIM domain
MSHDKKIPPESCPEPLRNSCVLLDEAREELDDVLNKAAKAEQSINHLHKRVSDAEDEHRRLEELLKQSLDELAILKDQMSLVTKVYSKVKKWMNLGGAIVDDDFNK